MGKFGMKKKRSSDNPAMVLGEEVSISIDRSSKINVTSNKPVNLPPIGVAAETKLVEIDDVMEVFKVSMLIHCHYREESITPDPSKPDDFAREVVGDSFWIPDIVLLNQDELEQDVCIRVNRYTGDVLASFAIVAVLRETLELYRFPFDRQLFRIEFKSPNAALFKWSLESQYLEKLDFPKLVEDVGILGLGKSKPVIDRVNKFIVSCDLNGWTLEKIMTKLHCDDEDPISLSKGEFTISIFAERNPHFYMFQFVLILFIIVLTFVAGVGIPLDELGDRLSVSLTLLLTAVAFKLVMSEALPVISYLTWMDKYVILSFCFLGVGVGENLFVNPRFRCLFSDQNLATCIANRDDTEADRTFYLIFFAAWVSLHLMITLFATFPNVVRQSWKQTEASQENDERVELSKYVRTEGGHMRTFDPATGKEKMQ